MFISPPGQYFLCFANDALFSDVPISPQGAAKKNSQYNKLGLNTR